MLDKLVSYKDDWQTEYKWFKYVLRIEEWRKQKSYIFYVDYGTNDCTGIQFTLSRYNTKCEVEWYFEEEGYLYFDLIFNVFGWEIVISMFS